MIPGDFLRAWVDAHRDDLRTAGFVHEIVAGLGLTYLDLFGPVVARVVVWDRGHGMIYIIDPETGKDAETHAHDGMTKDALDQWFRSVQRG